MLYEAISLAPAETGRYPTRVILGADIYYKLEREFMERMAVGLTAYPNGTHRKLWGVPLTIDKDNRELIEVGYMVQVEIREEE